MADNGVAGGKGVIGPVAAEADADQERRHDAGQALFKICRVLIGNRMLALAGNRLSRSRRNRIEIADHGKRRMAHPKGAIGPAIGRDKDRRKPQRPVNIQGANPARTQQRNWFRRMDNLARHTDIDANCGKLPQSRPEKLLLFT
jgi:hypothetical protein